MNKAIFIDKDGTLIFDVPYNVDPTLIRFEKFAFESLYQLQEKGFLLIIISNQQGIAAGIFNKEDLKIVEDTMRSSLEANKILLHGFYYCPHLPEANCECRKPMPGLIIKAANEMQINLSQSWMIGDILNDIEAGNRSGCKTILIDNGNETEWLLNSERTPYKKANDLKEATEMILLDCL